MTTRTSPRRRRVAAVVGGALALHAVVLVALDQLPVVWRLDPDAARSLTASAVAVPPVPVGAPGSIDVAVVALIDDAHAPPPLAVWGPGDLAGFAATHPLPNAAIDQPGDRAAERGGGATGGPQVWTGRRDDLDDATLLAEPWNDGRDYRAARDRTGRTSSSTEALHREPDPAAGDRAVERLARAGADTISHGASDGLGAADGDALWRDADPRFGLKPGREQDVRRGGATQVNRTAPLADRGASSADVTPRGEVARDREAVAAASAQTVPDPYDLTPAQSGGIDRGVAGAAADGALADGRGRGDGATRAAATVGPRDLSIKATPQDPYFRELYARLAKVVQFPRDLAIDLRAGRSIVRFALAPDGKLSDIGLHASSGYRGFDDELLRAVRTLRDLSPVPARLLDGRTELRVLVPFEFQNPVVR